jgi:hypothetical protein
MSHECPDCGQTCYCNGDIDDCDFGDVKAQIHCKHCQVDQDDEDNDEGLLEYINGKPVE